MLFSVLLLSLCLIGSTLIDYGDDADADVKECQIHVTAPGYGGSLEGTDIIVSGGDLSQPIESKLDSNGAASFSLTAGQRYDVLVFPGSDLVPSFTSGVEIGNSIQMELSGQVSFGNDSVEVGGNRYNLDDAHGIARVISIGGSANADITIPEKISYNSKTYYVAYIGDGQSVQGENVIKSIYGFELGEPVASNPTLPNNLNKLNISPKITVTGHVHVNKNAFACSYLNIKKIEAYYITGVSVTINGVVHGVDDRAFSNCGGGVTISSIKGSIGAYAFGNSAKNMDLSEVDHFGYRSFLNNNGLSQITISDGASIEPEAFNGCMATFTFNGSIKILGKEDETSTTASIFYLNTTVSSISLAPGSVLSGKTVKMGGYLRNVYLDNVENVALADGNTDYVIKTVDGKYGLYKNDKLYHQMPTPASVVQIHVTAPGYGGSLEGTDIIVSGGDLSQPIESKLDSNGAASFSLTAGQEYIVSIPATLHTKSNSRSFVHDGNTIVNIQLEVISSVYDNDFDFSQGIECKIDGFTYLLLSVSNFNVAQLISFGKVTDGATLTVPEYIVYEGVNYDVVSIGRDNNIKSTPGREKTHLEIVSEDSITSNYFVIFKGLVSLNDYAFAYEKLIVNELSSKYEWIDSGVQGLTFEKGVRSIGDYALCNSKIVTIDLAGCIEIGDYALSNSLINEISLPKGLNVGKGVFSGCSSLTSADVSVDVMGYMFENTPSLNMVTIKDGVRSIGNNSFYESGITSISLPGSCNTIGDYAFKGSQLVNIVASNINSLGTGAFDGCTRLNDVELGGSYSVLPMMTFRGCVELKSITLSDSCKNVGVSVFEGCVSLNEESLGSLLNKVEILGTSSLKGPKIQNLRLPAIKEMGSGVFNSSELRSIELGQSLNKLGDYCFDNCSLLTTIVLPKTDLNVGIGLFRGCTSLSDVDLGGMTLIPDGCFEGCTNLKSVDLTGITSIGQNSFKESGIVTIDIPESVSGLGERAFYKCKSLTSVTIKNESITTLPREIFAFCEDLSNLVLPESVINLADGAFYKTSKLTLERNVFHVSPDTVLSWSSSVFDGSAAIYEETVADSGVKYHFLKLKIHYGSEQKTVSVFAGTEGVKDASYDLVYELPADLIGMYSTQSITNFDYKDLITRVTISSDNSTYQTYLGTLYSKDGKTLVKAPANYDAEEMLPGVERIDNGAFSSSNVQAITFPSTLKVIENSAFSYSLDLQTVSFNEGLESIGDSAFKNTALTRVDIPSSVKSIGSSAFRTEGKTIQVNISKGSLLDTIGSYAFYATGELYLPESLTVVGTDAFGRYVDKVYLDAGLSIFNNAVFGSTNNPASGVVFYVPLGNATDKNVFSTLGGCVNGKFGGYFIWDDGKIINVNTKLSHADRDLYFVSSIGGIEPYWVDEGVTFGIKSSIGYAHHDIVVESNGAMISGTDGVYQLPQDTQFIYVSERETSEFFTVSFDSNGGSYVASLKIGSGRTILPSQIVTPYLNMNDFVGWYMDSALTSAYSFEMPVTADMVLYAKWESREPIITYHVAYGRIVAKCNGQDVESGSPIKSGEQVTLEYHVGPNADFVSWIVKTAAGSEIIDEEQTTLSVTEDTEVTVKVRYYSLSSILSQTIPADGPREDSKPLISWYTKNEMDTTMSNWTGHSSVPLIVGDYVYVRISDKILKIESDTGYIVGKCDSVDQKSYYHYLGYANGTIIDYANNEAYDLDLNKKEFDSPNGSIHVVFSDETGIYMMYNIEKQQYMVKYTRDFKEKLWDVSLAHTVFGQYGTVGSIFSSDGFIYYINADKGSESRGIVTLSAENGSFVDRIVLSDIETTDGKTISGFYLDDGWMTKYGDTVYLTCYSHGLFGDKVGDGKRGYVISVKTENGKFIEDTVLFTPTNQYSNSAFVVYNGRGYVHAGGILFVFNVQDMSLIYTTSSCFTHGGIVLNTHNAKEENGWEVSIYVIPYNPGSGLCVLTDRHGQVSGQFKDLGLKIPQFNTQAVRSDSDGRLFWYNDTGHLFGITVSEKNPYYFFIDDGETAGWYLAHGKNMYDAALSLGERVLSIGSTFEISRIHGKVVSDVTVAAVSASSDSFMQYKWTVIDSFNNREFDGDHYIIITARNASVENGSEYTYWDGSEFRTYTFQENVGDRNLVGLKMVPGNSVSVIRFYEGETELEGTSLIGVIGSDVLEDFPKVHKNGYIPVWKDVAGNEVTSLEGTKYVAGGSLYKLFWEAVLPCELTVIKNEYSDEVLVIDYVIRTTSTESLNIMVQVAYADKTFTRSPMELKPVNEGEIRMNFTDSKSVQPVKALITVYRGNILLLAEYIDMGSAEVTP